MNVDDYFPASACFAPHVPSDPQRAAVLDALATRHPSLHLAIAGRVLTLFGDPLLGIAAPVQGEAACVDLARRLALFHAEVHDIALPPSLEPQLAYLDAALRTLATDDFPDLARERARSLNPQVRFYVQTRNTNFDRALGIACHMFLAAKSRAMAAGPLAAVRTPLLRLALGFDCTDLDPDSLSAPTLAAIAAFFATLPNQRRAGQVLQTDTVSGYMAVITEFLEIRQRRPRRVSFQTHDSDRPNPSPGEAGQDRTGASESSASLLRSTTASAPAYRANNLLTRAADTDLADPDADTDPTNPYHPQAYRTLARTDDPHQPDLVADAETETLTGLLPADRVARLGYQTAWLTLARYVTPDAPQCLPLSTLALGYSALLGGKTLNDLTPRQLTPLLFYHLSLMTCRAMESLIATRIGVLPAVRSDDIADVTSADGDRLCHPHYDPLTHRLMAVPRVYPGLMADMRHVPEPETEEYAQWQERMAAHRLGYQPVALVREIVIDDIARALLTRLYALRGQYQATIGDNPLLFLRSLGHGQLAPYDLATVKARTVAIITAALRARYGDYRPLTLSQVRATGWAQLVAVEGVPPVLLQMIADTARPEVRAAGFYSTISRDQLVARAGAAQARFMARIVATHPDGDAALAALFSARVAETQVADA